MIIHKVSYSKYAFLTADTANRRHRPFELKQYRLFPGSTFVFMPFLWGLKRGRYFFITPSRMTRSLFIFSILLNIYRKGILFSASSLFFCLRSAVIGLFALILYLFVVSSCFFRTNQVSSIPTGHSYASIDASVGSTGASVWTRIVSQNCSI
jgi:hypothetical protein